jgi:hypothetical protein
MPRFRVAYHLAVKRQALPLPRPPLAEAPEQGT